MGYPASSAVPLPLALECQVEDHRKDVMLAMHLWVLVGFVVVYYVGRAVQFWNSRDQRKTAAAVEHIGKKFNGDGDKNGAAK
ncbi:hypothetical protein JHN45_38630 [Streptomyces sp. MBT53]|nr:hypothetical protein [Streptomyces sp. MBT53]